MSVRSHIKYLPQCAFNSHSMHPMDKRGGRDLHQYIDGDFIHMAGKKGAIKFNFLEHSLYRKKGKRIYWTCGNNVSVLKYRAH